MGLAQTPSGERTHIGIFGKRNAGKSQLMNAILGQNMSIVSDTLGTTTDPVHKAMELLPLGPVVFIDTPGLDDDGELGDERVKRAYEVLRKIDLAVVVIGMDDEASDLWYEKDLIEKLNARKIRYIVVLNKSDLFLPEDIDHWVEIVKEEITSEENIIVVSAQEGDSIFECKEKIAHLQPEELAEKPLVRDMLKAGDTIVLVVPVDSAAPKGRLILPQQQVIRDALEVGAMCYVSQVPQLDETIKNLVKPPRMVITDSQAFFEVSKIVPDEIPLTSFSILMSRYKGDLKSQVEAARYLESLKDGDVVLISEGCTHHRQCGDIGTQKLPNWILKHTGKDISFEFTSGRDFPEDLSSYALIVHCGGCTLNKREMAYRVGYAKDNKIPMTNYGVLISYMNGILDRTLIFDEE